MRFILEFCFIIATVVLGSYVYINYGDDIRTAFFEDAGEYRIYIGDTAMRVTVADTEAERRQGLSGVEALGDLEGKLFIFDQSDYYGIWMKDMLFPIDIIWLNDQLEVIHFETNVSPDTYPDVFAPTEPARFVLETKAFFVDLYKIMPGDKINLPSEILPHDVRESLSDK